MSYYPQPQRKPEGPAKIWITVFFLIFILFVVWTPTAVILGRLIDRFETVINFTSVDANDTSHNVGDLSQGVLTGSLYLFVMIIVGWGLMSMSKRETVTGVYQ